MVEEICLPIRDLYRASFSFDHRGTQILGIIVSQVSISKIHPFLYYSLNFSLFISIFEGKWHNRKSLFIKQNILRSMSIEKCYKVRRHDKL